MTIIPSLDAHRRVQTRAAGATAATRAELCGSEPCVNVVLDEGTGEVVTQSEMQPRNDEGASGDGRQQVLAPVADIIAASDDP